MSTYTDFVRSLPCVVSGYIGEEIDPHHIKGYSYLTHAGGSKKGTDLLCIPLRHKYHQELHDIGWKSFEKKYNINQLEEAVGCLLIAEKAGVIAVNKVKY